jgi:hypothetical protein
MTERPIAHRTPEIVVLGQQAINDLVGKVADVAAQPHTEHELAAWRAKNGREHTTETARSYAVVGETLMFLHKCADGVLVPLAIYPDGHTKIYTDHAHATEAFYPQT